jgi:hypothetical protein
MNFNDNFDLKKAKASLLSENYGMDNMDDMDNMEGMDHMDSLDEMAQLTGDLKSAIEAVISANPELNGLELKKKIKADQAVRTALAGDDLYDNQLNRFIELNKGERSNQQRGRKAGTPNIAPKASISADVISYFKGLSKTSPLWATYMENPAQAIADAKGGSAPEEKKK